MTSLKLISIFRKALLAGALACPAMPAVANVITDWDTMAVAVVAPAPLGQRELAMVHVAMFDAVNAIDRGYQPYLSRPAANPWDSKEAAAAAAAYKALAWLFPGQAATLQSTYDAYVA